MFMRKGLDSPSLFDFQPALVPVSSGVRGPAATPAPSSPSRRASPQPRCHPAAGVAFILTPREGFPSCYQDSQPAREPDEF